MRRYTTEELLKELKDKWGDKYNYSKTIYNGSRHKFSVICPKHGEFLIRLDKVRNGYECPLCSQENSIDIKHNNFIEKARKVHGDKYDYSKVEYKGWNKKVCIICPIHGEFWQTPSNHLLGQGCVKCYNTKRKGKYHLTLGEFIEKARKVHGNKYDYSKTEYNGIKNKVLIVCPEHGEFEQVAYDHLRGFKCSKCKNDEDRLSIEEFIEKAKEIHGDKYDYSKVEYVNNITKVCIICPEHGEFWQKPSHHLLGCGCKQCHSSRMERTIKQLLDKNNISFEEQYKAQWLGRQSLDFFLPEYNIAIECQGIQHVKSIKGFSETLTQCLERDIRKNKNCLLKNVRVIYICEKQYEKDFLKFNELYNHNNLLTLKNVYRYDKSIKNDLFNILKEKKTN